MTLPNKLTIGRLVMAGIFFAALELTNHELSRAPVLSAVADPRRLLFNLATVLFFFAAVTDFLDGYIARKYDLTSDFGRMADPFTDKVMTCGSFIFLSALPIDRAHPGVVFVPAWMSVLIVAREFLTTGLRGFVESKGKAFGSLMSGKVKMTLQCWTIGMTLFVLANFPRSPGWVRATRVFVWLTLAVTLLSGLHYIVAVRRTLRDAA